MGAVGAVGAVSSRPGLRQFPASRWYYTHDYLPSCSIRLAMPSAVSILNSVGNAILHEACVRQYLLQEA